MNKQIFLENYLLILKSTVEVYVHGTLESANKDVKELLQQGLNETIEHQKRVYNKMVDNNYYVVENVASSNINKLLKKLEQG